MNRQIIKKLILCLMTVILCVTTCAPAFASKGDRTLMHFSDEEQANDCYINSAFRMGDGFCIYYREGSMNPKQIILRYADAKAEPEKFILQDDMSAGEGDIVSVETEPATETDLPAAEDAAAVEGRRAAFAAGLRQRLPRAADVASEAGVRPVVCVWNAAPQAGLDMSAATADVGARIAAPVKEEDRLLAAVETQPQCLDELLREYCAAAHLHQPDRRQ